jgi:hypothetical protein
MAIVMAGPDLAVQLTNRDGPKARYGGAVSARFDSIGRQRWRAKTGATCSDATREAWGLNRLLEIGVMHFTQRWPAR